MKLADLDKGFFSALKVTSYLHHRGVILVVQEGVDHPSRLTLKSDLGQGSLDFDLPDDFLHTAQRFMATGEPVMLKIALFNKDSVNTAVAAKKVVVEIEGTESFGKRPQKTSGSVTPNGAAPKAPRDRSKDVRRSHSKKPAIDTTNS